MMSTSSNAAWKARDPERFRAVRASWMAARRLRVDALKAGPCMDCGGTFPPECMDFDHVRGAKVEKISNLYACREDRMLAEIAKCDLVCANCHRIRTRRRGQTGRA